MLLQQVLWMDMILFMKIIHKKETALESEFWVDTQAVKVQEKDNHLVYPVQVDFQVVVDHSVVKVGREHRAHRVKYMVVEDWIF